MPAKNKLRGTYYERKCVESAQKFGLKAERTWGSDGRSRGLHQEVDMVIEDTIYAQCKKRKKIAEHLKPIPEIHVQLVGEDRGGNLAIMTQDTFFTLLAIVNNVNKINEEGLCLKKKQI